MYPDAEETILPSSFATMPRSMTPRTRWLSVTEVSAQYSPTIRRMAVLPRRD